MGILNKKRCCMYFLIICVVATTTLLNIKKLVETHKMLYQLENWENLDEEEKEAMETLKFIEKAHELLHEHDHLGLGAIDEHEADDSKVFENDEVLNEEVAVKYEKEEENAPEAAPQKAEESFEAAHAMNLDEEGKRLKISYVIERNVAKMSRKF